MTIDERALDEAIAHAREVAKRNRILLDSDELVQKSYDAYFDKLKCEKCADEHEQLVEWLEELKEYREIGTVEECRNSVLNIPKAYNKAIDDFVNACKEDILCQTFGLHINGIERIAEQLKAGGDDENTNQKES